MRLAWWAPSQAMLLVFCIVGKGGIEGVFELAIFQMKVAEAVDSGIMQRLIFLVVQDAG